MKDAIQSTFKRRDTPLPIETPLALSTEFAEDSTKMAQWTAFIRKGKLLANEFIALGQIVPILEKLIMPILSGGKDAGKIWSPKAFEWIEKSE